MSFTGFSLHYKKESVSLNRRSVLFSIITWKSSMQNLKLKQWNMYVIFNRLIFCNIGDYTLQHSSNRPSVQMKRLFFLMKSQKGNSRMFKCVLILWKLFLDVTIKPHVYTAITRNFLCILGAENSPCVRYITAFRFSRLNK